MLVPLSWLRDFAPDLGDDVGALTDTFNELGLVVDGVRPVGAGLDDVVVARVLEIHAIDGADYIRRVVVDAGSEIGSEVQVVCGAHNFASGDLVAFGPVGAALPNGMTLSRRKMKGVESNGMICSPDELGLGERDDGIMVLSSGTPGVALRDALGLVADVVFDLDIETNRPDALSMAGVARDVAAKLHIPFALPEPAAPEAGGAVSITVESPALCPRFTGTVITGIVVGPSPQEVQRRLTLAGMRAINNVVDASNYVMLELGQPTHPYDLARLPGGGLLVREARAGETLVTLDGIERTLGDGPYPDCLICDAESAPVGIGGIMGGESSEIGADTTTVLLEAAYFTPMAIARTAKRVGLRSEASARFERGCDPEGIARAVGRFCALLPDARVAAGLVAVDSPSHLPGPRRVQLRTARVNAMLGTELSDADVRGYLAPIGFVTEPVREGVHDVVIPTFRPDSEREIDVIEEVARHHGYSSIARTLPSSPRVGALSPYQRDRRALHDVLLGAGCTEAFGLSLLAPGELERAGISGEALVLENPLVREESVLRTSLLPGMLRAIAFNASRQNSDVRLFEVGHVYPKPASAAQALPAERERLAVALAGVGGDAVGATKVWRIIEQALRLDGVYMEPASAPGLHPTRTVRLRTRGGDELGAVGEVDPDVLHAHEIDGRVGWIDCDVELLLTAERRADQARAVSRFPASDIDLAFTVGATAPAAAIEATLREAAGPLLVDLRLFDVYRGPGMPEGTRSLAYRLRFCALDRTLTDEEVAAARRRSIDAVEAAHPARLRG
jgi:phenylalanyl-tRNA synthetase beta chain